MAKLDALARFDRLMARWDERDRKREAKEAAEYAAYKGCKHLNLPVKYDAADCDGKDDAYVRMHYPRFHGPCPDCRELIIGYASWEHYVAGDW